MPCVAVSGFKINIVVDHLPDPDKGHNPGAVSHLLVLSAHRRRKEEKT